LEFLVELGDLERAGGDLIELLRVSTVGTLDVAIEFGGTRRQHEQAPAALLAGLREEGGELTAAINSEGKGHAFLQSFEEGGGGTGRGAP
jgi:hypothetical protein